MQSTNVILLYVPIPDNENANRISHFLLTEKSAFCINILSKGRSFFIKNNTIHNAEEYYMIIKTDLKNKENAKKTVRENHPYNQPIILEIEAKSDSDLISIFS